MSVSRDIIDSLFMTTKKEKKGDKKSRQSIIFVSNCSSKSENFDGAKIFYSLFNSCC